MLKCKVCGTANSSDSSVCVECGAKLRASMNNSTDNSKEIFSNTKSEEFGKTGDQRDLFSSGEKYEKVRKGAVLEKIYEQERAMGEVSHIQPPAPETVKPIVINRQSSSDIVKGTRKYSSESGKARAAASKNHKIPQRIIEPSDSQLMSHKIKAKVTPESNSDENEKVELTQTNVIEDIQKRNRNNPKSKKNKKTSEKSTISTQQDNVPKNQKNKTEKTTGDSDSRSRNPKKKSSEKPKTEPVVVEKDANVRALKTEKTVYSKADQKQSERTKKVKKAAHEEPNISDNAKVEISSVPVDQNISTEEKVQKKEGRNGKPVQKKAKPKNSETKADFEAKSDRPIKKETKSEFSEVKVSDSKAERPVKKRPKPVDSEKSADVSKTLKKAPKEENFPSESDEKKSVIRKAVKNSDKEGIKAKKTESEAAEKTAKKDNNKKKKSKPEKNKSDGLPKSRVIPTRTETADEIKRRPSSKTEAADKYGFSPKDIEENRNLSALAYIGILFLIPLAKVKKSDFCKAHVKQGFAVFIYSLIISLITLAAVVGLRILLVWVLKLNFMIYNLAAAAIAVLMLVLLLVPVFSGAAAAFNGVYKSVPIVGKFVNKKK